ncbi:MAG: OmpA family protein [Paracoccaceae bacterium]
MLRFRLAAAISLLLLPAMPAFPGDLTDEQLLALFAKQREAFKAAKEGGGQTRGLTLQTMDSVTATTLAPTMGAPAGADAGGAIASAGDGGVTVKPAGGLTPLVPDATASAGSTAAPLPDGTAPAVQGDVQPLTASAGGDGLAPLVGTGGTETTATGTAPALVQQAAADSQVIAVLAPEMQVNINVRFGFDSAALSDDQKPALAQMCRVMRLSDIGLFEVAGHTDGSGSADYNMKLSQLRAEEVMRYLVTDCGIAPERLRAVGLGEELPLNTGDPRAPENRRVEFKALS